MKKCLLSVLLVASVSCSAVFAQPAAGLLVSVFGHKNECPLEIIGNTLKTLMALNLKPMVSLETTKSALSELNDLNNQSCSKAQITVANNSQGMTMVSGRNFTEYGCYQKDGGLVMCAVFTSNYQVA